MSREEAIEFGKMWLQINEDAKDSDTYNFFKFSIEALEQEATAKNDLGIDNQNIRLIDADALIKRLRPKHFDWWGEGEQDDFSKGNNSMLEEVIEAIEEFTLVTQIKPKGYWIEHQHEAGANWEYSRYECSECHNWAEDDSNYCPCCGCRMEE